MPTATFTDARAPIPEEALRYLARKKPVTSYSYKDVWAEEHAAAFTVAKGMQLDVVRDIQKHLVEAMKNGTSLPQFKKDLTPLLKKKGWWGKRPTTDSKTGKRVQAQLGSDRRLETIWTTNMRSAYMVGKWERSQASKSHPYLIYKLGPVQTRHRAEHAAWAGTLLAKDDPWWRTHYPPLGYNCNCYVSLVSRRRYERLTGTRGVRTKPIPDTMMTYVNKRTGATRQAPQGVTPGFEWNQGDFGRGTQLALSLMEKAERLSGKNKMEKIMKEHLAHPIMRNAYKSFVSTALKKEKSSSKMVPLGMLSDTYAKYAKARGASIASGLVVLQERVLIPKQAKHTRDDSGLTVAQWQSLPDVLQNPDRVYWDHKEENNSLLFVKAIEGGGVLFLPLRLNKSIGGVPMDTVASAFAHKNITIKQMDERNRFENLK